MKKIIAIIISLIVAYFGATPVGQWFSSKYAVGGFISVGAFPGFLDGFLFTYVFVASMITPLFTERIKIGFYVTLPILILNALHPYDPQLVISLLLLAAGLGIAWFFLFLKRQAAAKK